MLTDNGKAMPNDTMCKTSFMFYACMAAVVADKRGGRPSLWISECADFITEVIGHRLSVSDSLPEWYDWRVSSAIESAHAMMEYDN